MEDVVGIILRLLSSTAIENLLGTRSDSKMAVKGVRIYMSHPAAKRLGEVLGEILEEGQATSVDKGNRQ